jgi:hypothetical protein
MARLISIGNVYQHFKGFKARVITVAQHTETNEMLVVYECYRQGHDGVYARPIDMFLSEVDHNKYPEVTQKYRFALLRDGVIVEED